MTNEDAIQFLDNMKSEEAGRAIGRDGFYAELMWYHVDALNMAIKALEDKDVLDKIRAEIDEQYDIVHPYNISCAEGLEMALEIIDKYKAESEG